MKKLILLLIVIMTFSSALYGAEKIKIGFFSLEPFMIDNGANKKPTGITIDYYEKYVAPKMGVEVEWVGPLPFARLNGMLEAGELDMIVNLSKTDERAGKFIFPESPQSKIISCLAFPKNAPINKITKADDVFGKKIGYIVTGFIPPMLINDKITFDNTTDADYRKTNFEKMLGGRIDAVLDINYISFMYFIKIKGYDSKVKVLLLPADPSYVWGMFTKSEKGERLVKTFNTVQKGLDRDKIFDTLAKQYLK